jgi:hypothetical protein
VHLRKIFSDENHINTGMLCLMKLKKIPVIHVISWWRTGFQAQINSFFGYFLPFPALF